MESNPIKAVFQKHGIAEPCSICRDNFVPQTQWRDQERRCLANPRNACGCCNGCRAEGKCDGKASPSSRPGNQHDVG